MTAAEPPVPPSVMDRSRTPRVRHRAPRGRAAAEVRGRAAGPRPRVRAGAAAAARRAARGARAAARVPPARGRGRPRRGRGGRLVPRRRERRSAAEPRCPLGLGPRAAAAPRRRAGPCARRPRPRRARLRVCSRARRGAAAGERAAGADQAGGRRGAGDRGAGGGPRARRLRARRAGGGARPVRRPRRHRRRLPDDGPGAAAHRVLRRRDRAGARLLAVHAASAPSSGGRRRLSRRRAASPTCSSPRWRTTTRRRRCRTTSSPSSTGPPDFVWQPDEVRRVWSEEGLEPVSLAGASELDPFPQGQPFAFEAQRPAISARGLAEAETELAGFVRGGNRVVVAFPHAGEALRTQNLLRRADSRVLEPGRRAARGPGAPVRGRAGAARLRLARARPRAAARHAGLPEAAAARRPPPRPGARDLRRPAHGRLRRPRGPRRRQAARLRDARGGRRHARLPLRRLPRRGPPLRPARAARQGLEVHRRRCDRARALQARRQGLAEPQGPRARVGARARRRADRPLRPAPAGARPCLRPLERVAGPARGRVPVPRDRGSGAGDRGREGGSRGAAPDGPARLRRRRLRQDGGRRAGGVRGRRQRQADPRPLPDDDPRRAALEHVQGPLPRLPGARRDGLALPHRRRHEAGAAGLRRGQGRRPRRHAPRPLPRRDPEGARPRHPRRGAALRRRPEGAHPQPAPGGGRARALGDADPAHAAHVALRAPGHLRHRDAARGPAPDPHDRRRVRRGADHDSARARDRARRPGVLPPQPRRDDRGGRSEAPAALPEAPLHRRAREDARARARGEDARVPARRRGRARLDDDHRVRDRHPAGEHARSSSVPTRSASPSSTRSAGGSAAPT